MSVHSFVWSPMFNISGYIARSGADGSHGNSMFNFPRTYQTVLLGGHTIWSSYKRSRPLEGLQILERDIKRQIENIQIRQWSNVTRAQTMGSNRWRSIRDGTRASGWWMVPGTAMGSLKWLCLWVGHELDLGHVDVYGMLTLSGALTSFILTSLWDSIHGDQLLFQVSQVGMGQI